MSVFDISPAWLVIGYDLALVACLLMLVLRQRETQTIYGWGLALIFLPVLGMALFLLVGLNRVPRRLERRMRHAAIFAKRVQISPTRLITAEQRRAATGWDSLPLLAEHLGCMPMRTGNAIEFFDDGREVFRRVFQDIANAKHHVHLEKYIFRTDHLGTALIDLLIERRRAGVEVRVLIDAIGAIGTQKHLRRLRDAGGRTASFLPLTGGLSRFAPNLRNHRKVVICDGAIGYVGGLNVGDEYLGRRYRDRTWFDAHLRIAGPAVSDLQRVFIEDWDFAEGELLSSPEYLSANSECGPYALQILPSGPDQDQHPNRSLFFAAASLAREELRVASPYVVPDPGIRDALIHAALRGVRVTVLTQAWPPDKFLTYYCGRFYFEELLQAGVHIYEYLPGMMHAKMLIADHAWGSVGTSNLDSRSFRLNFEVDAASHSEAYVRLIAARFDAALNDARRVDAKTFAERSIGHRIAERCSHLFAPLL